MRSILFRPRASPLRYLLQVGSKCRSCHHGTAPQPQNSNLWRASRLIQRTRYGLVCHQQHKTSKPLTHTDKEAPNIYDAIVVLGGGLTMLGGIPAWGQRRLQTALLLRKHTNDACPILCLGGGTPHKQAILSDTGHVIHEGSAYAAYLLKQGTPARSVLKEVSSYDTVGNAYFCLVIHALPAGWRRLAVVTSDFHMPRSEAIFRHCATLAGAWRQDTDWFNLSFHSASDAGVFPGEILQARKEREAESLQAWHTNAERLTTLSQLHSFIHQEHACYSVAHQAVFGRPELDDVKDQALGSY